MIFAAEHAAYAELTPYPPLDTLDPWMKTLVEMGRLVPAVEYAKAAHALDGMARRTVAFFDDYDLFVSPTLALPPPPIGSMSGAGIEDMLRFLALTPFTALWNTTGQPAVSLPLAEDENGLPVGVQVVGSAGSRSNAHPGVRADRSRATVARPPPACELIPHAWHRWAMVVRSGRIARDIARGEPGGAIEMGDYGVAVTWADMKPGREQQALEVWADGAALNEKAVADGRIERWDAVLFDLTGTPPVGAIRLFGTQDQIEEFVRSDDFRSVIQRASLTVNGVGYRRFVTGDVLLEAFASMSERVDRAVARAISSSFDGGPANACAMSIHSRASGPVTASAVSSGRRRLVTTRQKSSASPRTTSVARIAPRPGVAVGRVELDEHVVVR